MVFCIISLHFNMFLSHVYLIAKRVESLNFIVYFLKLSFIHLIHTFIHFLALKCNTFYNFKTYSIIPFYIIFGIISFSMYVYVYVYTHTHTHTCMCWGNWNNQHHCELIFVSQCFCIRAIGVSMQLMLIKGGGWFFLKIIYVGFVNLALLNLIGFEFFKFVYIYFNTRFYKLFLNF